jgi:undecaprenyl-diphosphatase
MLQELNQGVFLWINQDAGNHFAWLDALMRGLSNPRTAVVPAIVAAAWLLIRERKRGLHLVVGVILLLVFTDATGAILKHAFEIPRPCATLTGVRLLVGCGHSSGFPSNHAINMSALALYAGLFYRRALPVLVAVALAVGVSRVYVGAHYPFDVLFGWIWGGLLGAGAWWLHRYRFPQLFTSSRDGASRGQP